MPDARGAAREAARAAARRLAGPEAGGKAPAEAALVFATPDHAEAALDLVAEVGDALETEAVVGATVHGVLASGLANESGPAVGVAALAGCQAVPFLLPDVGDDERSAGPEIAGRLRPSLGEPGPQDLVLLHADPYGLDLRALLDGVESALAPAACMGLTAADAPGTDPLVWSRRAVASGAVGGLVVRGAAPPRQGLTHSCQPVGDPRTVTRARGHWVLELDGRPALEAYREAARGPLGSNLHRAAEFVLVALPGGRAAAGFPAAGAYVVHELAGFDEKANAFALPRRVGPGDELAFAWREPEAAREDLKRLLRELADPSAGLALYYGCRGRAAALFGVEGLEAGYLELAFPKRPVLGVLASSQIGAVGNGLEVLAHAAVVSVLPGA